METKWWGDTERKTKEEERDPHPARNTDHDIAKRRRLPELIDMKTCRCRLAIPLNTTTHLLRTNINWIPADFQMKYKYGVYSNVTPLSIVIIFFRRSFFYYRSSRRNSVRRLRQRKFGRGHGLRRACSTDEEVRIRYLHNRQSEYICS